MAIGAADRRGGALRAADPGSGNLNLSSGLNLRLYLTIVAAIVHAADIQDRDGAPRLLKVLRSAFPWLRHVFADGAYAGGKLQKALAKLGKWTIEIVKRSDAARGFVVLPRRWVVERTLAWLNRNRRLAKDFEASIESATTWLYIASVKLMSRRLGRS